MWCGSRGVVVVSMFLIPLSAGLARLAVADDWKPDLNLPEFLEDEAVLFAPAVSGGAPIKVRTGDIALRAGDDRQLAVGTYPIPANFKENMASAYGANWSYFRMVFNELGVTAVNNRDNLLATLVNDTFDANAMMEVGNPRRQNTIPKKARITLRKLMKMRGAYKPMRFDEYPDGSPEAEAHKKIPGFQKNYYRLNGLDEDVLDSTMHYYPGTPFVTHAGIFAVERGTDGRAQIFIYDAVPGQDGDIEDERFPSGLRKITVEQFFLDEAEWGVVVRPKNTTPAQNVQALKWVWNKYYNAQIANPVVDRFDYTFDWRQSEKFACSAFVWHSFAEGAQVNILSDLSFALVPAWVIRAKTDYTVKMNIQISPQSLVNSLQTERVVDFDANWLDAQLAAVSEGNLEPIALPPPALRNSQTGHLVYSVGPEGLSELGAVLH